MKPIDYLIDYDLIILRNFFVTLTIRKFLSKNWKIIKTLFVRIVSRL